MAIVLEHKERTRNKRIEKASLPKIAYVSLTQHLGKPCDKILVDVGKQVLRGELIATSDSKVFSPIHAPISGKVISIEEYSHPTIGKSLTVVIENDGQDTPIKEFTKKPEQEVKKLTVSAIREMVFKAGVVGLGGACFPTHIKLSPLKPLDTLIINIAECEPYLTADSQLVIEKIQEIILGIELVRRCVGAKRVYLAMEESNSEVIKVVKNATQNTDLKICILEARYPQGGEKQLIKSILGIEVPRGKIPPDVGVSVQNVSTVYAIYEAVYLEKPLYERVITVTGPIVQNPKNLLARIGTPIRELIDCCLPLVEDPAQIIMGGPMMGFAQYTDNVPTVKATNGIILFGKKDIPTITETACIRCGCCIKECSMQLMPCLIAQAVEKDNYDEAQRCAVMDCIECGLCSFVCPAKRNIIPLVRKAKAKIIAKSKKQ
ncbi:MAG: electron transport complex subunit RsxC [Candidatus Omnitrophica bacterium]|nr:electron transport complex subunit RsxC [Candidatus Omnitrophota bacterium]